MAERDEIRGVNRESSIYQRRTRLYEIVSEMLIITEPGMCDEFRLTLKWEDEGLEHKINVGVDADGRFNTVYTVSVSYTLSRSFHMTSSRWC